ncbi:MAG: hypothetical protein O7H41_18150 [Planctomycetota bacterium]|nr:hypothetical protein [Planctomycetota bacterium]
MFNLVGKVASVVFLVAVIAVGVVVGVSLIRSDGGDDRVDTFRYILADRAAGDAAASIGHYSDIEKICLLPVGGDIDREMTELLEEHVRALGAFRLIESGKVRDAIEEVMEGKEGDPISIVQAIDIGRRVGAEAVMMGNLKKFLPPKRGAPAEIDFDLDVIDVKKAKTIGEAHYEETLDRKFSLAYFSAWMSESSGWIRLLAWIVISGGAPFATSFLVQRVTRMERNAANLALLSGYTLFDIFLAYFLLGFLVRGFWLGLLVLIGFLAAAIYNYIACTIIYEMGK